MGKRESVKAMYQDEIPSIHNARISIALEEQLFEKPNDGLNLIMVWIVAKKPRKVLTKSDWQY